MVCLSKKGLLEIGRINSTSIFICFYCYSLQEHPLDHSMTTVTTAMLHQHTLRPHASTNNDNITTAVVVITTINVNSSERGVTIGLF